MTQLASIDLQPLAGSRTPRYATMASDTTSRLVAYFGRRDLIAVVAFCAIGLILTFGVLTHAPDALTTVGGISLVP
jgi:hypothetical protein